MTPRISKSPRPAPTAPGEAAGSKGIPPRSSIVVGFLAAALLAGCARTQAEPAGHFAGLMRSSCAPHDAASTEFDLRADTGASLWLNLWPGVVGSPPATIRFDIGDNNGQGRFCSSPGDCSTLEWGVLDLQTGPAGPISGSWRIGLEGGGELEGTFEAEWLLVQALCG